MQYVTETGSFLWNTHHGAAHRVPTPSCGQELGFGRRSVPNLKTYLMGGAKVLADYLVSALSALLRPPGLFALLHFLCTVYLPTTPSSQWMTAQTLKEEGVPLPEFRQSPQSATVFLVSIALSVPLCFQLTCVHSSLSPSSVSSPGLSQC